MLAIGEESFDAEHGIPCVRRGRQPADLVVIGGGQMFMRRSTEARLRREAVRVERLLPRGRSFALIGYPEQPPGDGSLDALADTIAAALAPFDRPIRLVGISYGALVAVRVAARHPEIVSRLALVSGGHAFGDEGPSGFAVRLFSHRTTTSTGSSWTSWTCSADPGSRGSCACALPCEGPIRRRR